MLRTYKIEQVIDFIVELISERLHPDDGDGNMTCECCPALTLFFLHFYADRAGNTQTQVTMDFGDNMMTLTEADLDMHAVHARREQARRDLIRQRDAHLLCSCFALAQTLLAQKAVYKIDRYAARTPCPRTRSQ